MTKREKLIKIMEVILEHSNGYSKKEIKEKNMGEECEGHELWVEIEEVLSKK